MRGVGLLALCVVPRRARYQGLPRQAWLLQPHQELPRRGGQDGGAIEPAARLEIRTRSQL